MFSRKMRSERRFCLAGAARGAIAWLPTVFGVVLPTYTQSRRAGSSNTKPPPISILQPPPPPHGLIRSAARLPVTGPPAATTMSHHQGTHSPMADQQSASMITQTPLSARYDKEEEEMLSSVLSLCPPIGQWMLYTPDYFRQRVPPHIQQYIARVVSPSQTSTHIADIFIPQAVSIPVEHRNQICPTTTITTSVAPIPPFISYCQRYPIYLQVNVNMMYIRRPPIASTGSRIQPYFPNIIRSMQSSPPSFSLQTDTGALRQPQQEQRSKLQPSNNVNRSSKNCGSTPYMSVRTDHGSLLGWVSPSISALTASLDPRFSNVPAPDLGASHNDRIHDSTGGWMPRPNNTRESILSQPISKSAKKKKIRRLARRELNGGIAPNK